jgi:hypothetical protein
LIPTQAQGVKCVTLAIGYDLHCSLVAKQNLFGKRNQSFKAGMTLSVSRMKDKINNYLTVKFKSDMKQHISNLIQYKKVVVLGKDKTALASYAVTWQKWGYLRSKKIETELKRLM